MNKLIVSIELVVFTVIGWALVVLFILFVHLLVELTRMLF